MYTIALLVNSKNSNRSFTTVGVVVSKASIVATTALKLMAVCPKDLKAGEVCYSYYY
jgi:hypothetical protein